MQKGNEPFLEIMTRPLYGAGFGKPIPARNVLVLAPHQDDEVLGCGGTLLRYLEQDTGVTIIYLTDGRYGVKAGEAEIRRMEALAAWAGFARVSQIFCDYEDSRLYQYKEDAVAFLGKKLEELQPEVVFTPWPIDSHSDHTYASAFLHDALEATGYPKCIVEGYEVAYPLYANHTVNITKQWEKKLELLDAYKSQENLNIRQFITSLNQYRAQLIRLKSVKAAESFFAMDEETYKCFIGSILKI